MTNASILHQQNIAESEIFNHENYRDTNDEQTARSPAVTSLGIGLARE